MTKTISWFEIPATDLERAQKFYEAVLNTKLNRTSIGGEELAIFPYDREQGATGGALIQAENGQPAVNGQVVYLFSTESVDAVLDRVPKAGGQIARPRFELPNGVGVIGAFIDSEGNRVGVHAMK